MHQPREALHTLQKKKKAIAPKPCKFLPKYTGVGGNKAETGYTFSCHPSLTGLHGLGALGDARICSMTTKKK